MIASVERFKQLLRDNFEIDDIQAVDIIIAVAISHKLGTNEMLWLRVIGASGTGKTELLRVFEGQVPYCSKMEIFTAGAIQRGYKFSKKADNQQLLLDRINGTLVITKELAGILTKNPEEQNKIFGLLRSVHDGELSSDFGSEEGHLTQTTKFDWIMGTTQFVERQRQVEYLLGSRFIDVRWGSPIQRGVAIDRAIDNDGKLTVIRKRLVDAMAEVITEVRMVDSVKLDYISTLANIASTMRTPVDRDKYSHEITDIPEIELGTRFGQSLARISRGLMSIGVDIADIKPYMNRMVLDSMTKIRSQVVKAWMSGLTKQSEIAARVEMSDSAISRVIEEFRILRWQQSWIDTLNNGGN
jgi:hypothetical protein